MHDVMQVFLATIGQVEPSQQPGLLELILEADIIVQSVLFILLGMSVVCWIIIFNKFTTLNKAESRSKAFLDQFWKASRLEDVYDELGRFDGGSVPSVFRAGYVELSKLTNPDNKGQTRGMLSGEDNLQRALRRAAMAERTRLEGRMTFLATTGSTAPFIGLFGTVWGILLAFQKIGATGNASIQTVGPDIAHALIATAVGLAAAIPAVMAYNFFNRRIRVMNTEMENFSDDFLNIVKRHFQVR
ncbi:MAG: protein TolQ [Myxococcota bacterium]